MIEKQILQYFFSKAVPGLINFSSIAIYTRILSPHEYGIYSIALITSTFLGLVFFQWAQLSLLRFYSENVNQEEAFVRTVFYCFIISALPLVFFAPVIYIFLPSLNSWPVLALVVILAITQAWFDLIAEIARVKLEPMRYGAMAFMRSTLSLSIGVAIALMGGSYYGPLNGLVLGASSAALIFGMQYMRGRINIYSGLRLNVNSYLHYGIPLTLTFALAMVIAGTDRLMIASILSESEAGSYAAGFDFIWQLITLAMVVINLAVYPITLNAYAKNGDKGALAQLSLNASLLLAVSLPLACVLGVLAPQWSEFVLGESYRDTGRSIAPWIAAAAVFAGMRAYHLDLAFQIKSRTKYQVVIVGVTAIFNIILNFWLIPVFGVVGSAYATLISYILSFVLSACLGRKMINIPIFHKDSMKVFFATLLFFVILCGVRELSGYLFIVATVLCGVIYIFALLGLNFMGSRTYLKKRAVHAEKI